ncbi:hypothetical protein LSM04_002095 [Trypanosoma melophagium]|uniref:uncharacterized protein n=1 Tax=Trypanosoma melophagium TaxID=715481 RepID=UPI00351AA746|nr:hypothetical protein LSM04_002095 [Trypanosoma melophagium]
MLSHFPFPRLRLSLVSSTSNSLTITALTLLYGSSSTSSHLFFSTRWSHTVCRSENTLFTHITEKEAQLLAQLSEALMQDEANALAVSLPENNSDDCNNQDNKKEKEEGSWMAGISSQDYMDLTMNPILPQQQESGLQSDEMDKKQQEQEGEEKNKDINSNTNNVNNKGHEELERSHAISSTEESSLSRVMRDVLQCRRTEEMSIVLSNAISAVMTTPATIPNRAASELLLSGTDVKALLSDGTLRDLCIEEKCLSQCDFSTVSFLSVNAIGVDYSRSLFYAAVFHNCVFVNCCFDGCVMKELRCSGNVKFERCSFRFAHMVLRLSSERTISTSKRSIGITKGKSSEVMFDHCDFDLCDFDGSDPVPLRCFVDCCNTHLASKFPPRVNAS